jgi:hypothetical protein
MCSYRFYNPVLLGLHSCQGPSPLLIPEYKVAASDGQHLLVVKWNTVKKNGFDVRPWSSETGRTACIAVRIHDAEYRVLRNPKLLSRVMLSAPETLDAHLTAQHGCAIARHVDTPSGCVWRALSTVTMDTARPQRVVVDQPFSHWFAAACGAATAGARRSVGIQRND